MSGSRAAATSPSLFRVVLLLLLPIALHSFLLPATPLAKPPTPATALHAHSHLQAALGLIQGASSSPSSGPASSDPYTPPPLAQGVHFASTPDSVEASRTGTGDKTKVVTQHTNKASGAAVTNYLEIALPTKDGISLHDITPQIRHAIQEAGVQEGWVNVVSRHTTTAVTLNECESRLMDDVRQFLLRVAPPHHPYLHNDIHLRPATEDDKRRVGDWDLDEWRAQEPKNCHSHLLSMLLGNTLMLPVSGGKLMIGRWQSVMMVELDGPRERTVGIQVAGFQ